MSNKAYRIDAGKSSNLVVSNQVQFLSLTDKSIDLILVGREKPVILDFPSKEVAQEMFSKLCAQHWVT